MEYRLLGALQVSEAGREISLGGPKQRAVLVHLLLRANQTVTTKRLIDLVWSDEPPAAARSTLQGYVSHLRSALGTDRLQGRPQGYILNAAPSDIDVCRFEALVVQARRQVDVDPAAAARLFDEALGLWGGPALDDLSGQRSLQPEIARLEELRLAATEERLGAELELGRHGELVPALQTLVAAHPLRERLWAHLIVGLYRCGRQAEALSAYEWARQRLADELGIDPSPELQQLHEQVLRQNPGLEATGEPLRGYRLLEEVGAGYFGTVHRAFQTQVGREVAIKVVHRRFADAPRFVRRFEAEAQLVARLEHPHIVPLYDFWREPDGAYLVMRYLRGGSLRERLAAGPLETREAVQLVDQVAGALAAAHRHGVVHRDVKPANILFDHDGHAYLSDFGIARDLAAGLAGQDGSASPPAYYLSPEEIRREPVTPQTDVYSLGLVLYEALAGRHPFADTSVEELADRQLREPLPRLRTRRPDVPVALEEVLRRATAKHQEHRYPDVRELATAFREAAVAPAPVPVHVGDDAVTNPFKGLRPFGEADAADFFGREAFVERLLARMAEDTWGARFLAVVGPSGSGKSSAVRAGLLPALRRGALARSDRWFVAEMHPGTNPFHELEGALLRVAVDPPLDLGEQLADSTRGLVQAADHILPADGSELLLVVDQFEELFSLVDDENQRSRFLATLHAAATVTDSRVRIVTTVRADFFDGPLSYATFGELVAARNESVPPLSTDELQRAVTGPAERVGVGVDAALLTDVVTDVAAQPGALPLLQYALTELFDRCQDAIITVEAYHDIGGVSGALARRAEDLYGRLDDDGRGATRQLFLRLVTVGSDGREDTRRRVLRAELTTLEVEPKAMETAVDTFGARRLLSFDRDPVTRGPTVEVAHEALLREWGRLRGWIEAAREDIRTHQRLTTAARDWVDADRDPGFLLRGAHLARLDAWAATSGLALTAAERDYLDASRTQRDAERDAEEARAERERALERRSLVRLRALVAVFAVLGLVASTLTVVALTQRARAEQAVRHTTVRELVAESTLALEEDPERSILLALEAVAVSRRSGEPPLPEAVAALHRATQTFRLEHILDDGHWVTDVSPDGRWLATTSFDPETRAAGDDMVIWDARSGERQRTLASDAQVRDFRFSPDGRHLAVAHRDSDGTSGIALWDPTTWQRTHVLPIPARIPRGGIWVAWSPDGRWLAASAVDQINFERPHQTVVVWDVQAGGEPSSFRTPAHPDTLALLDGGTVLLAGTDDVRSDEVGFYDTAGRLIDRLHTSRLEPERLLVDGVRNRLLAADRQAIGAWDLETGDLLWFRSDPGLGWVRVEPHTGLVATARFDGRMGLHDGEDGSQLTVLAGATGRLLGLAIYPGGERLASSGYGETRIWDATPAGPSAVGSFEIGHAVPFAVAVSPDGDEVAVASAGVFQRLDVATGETLGDPYESDEIGSSSPAPTSPDWGLMAVVASSGEGWVVDLATGTPESRLPVCTSPRAFRHDGSALVVDGLFLCPAGEAPAGADLRSRVLDPRSGEELFDLGERTILPGPRAAAFSPASAPEPGRYLAVVVEQGPAWGTAEIYDLVDSRPVATLELEADKPTVVAFDPTGRYLAGGTRNGRAWTLDLDVVASGATVTDALVFDRVVDSGVVTTVDLNAHGVLATSAFGSLRLWDIHTNELIADLAVDIEVPPRATFAPGGDVLYYVDAIPSGHALRRFVLDIDELITFAESRVTRGLTDVECRRNLNTERCPPE